MNEDKSRAIEYVQKKKPDDVTIESIDGPIPAKKPGIPLSVQISRHVEDMDINWAVSFAASRVRSKSNGYVASVLSTPEPQPTTNR